MTTIQSAPAASVHTAAAAVEGVLGGIDAGLARCADTICRKVLRIPSGLARSMTGAPRRTSISRCSGPTVTTPSGQSR